MGFPSAHSRHLPTAAQPVPERVRTLYDPRFEHESCGVGFIATLTNTPSHTILTKALTALSRLAHRGAIAADGTSSDGIGICTAVPREFLLGACGVALDPGAPFAVGSCFYPAGLEEDRTALERALADQGFRVLAWRKVPTRPEVLGEIALSTMPVIRQVLLTSDDPKRVERRLYLAHKSFERSGAPGYLCSLSSRTLIEKSICSGRGMPAFYLDLADERYTTPFAVFHQRYATNVAPSWDRAQPLRILSHNGEINTIWGNRARMDARAKTNPDELQPMF